MNSAEQKQTLVIDIGASSIKSALVTKGGGRFELSCKERTELQKFNIAELEALVKALVAKYKPANIAISTLGTVTHQGVVRKGGTIEGYVVCNWKEFLAPQNINVKVLNDGQCAALGVFHADFTVRGHSLVHFVVGSGIGGSIILDGKLWKGQDGFAGHFGRMPVTWENKFYQVAELASGRGIEFLVKQQLGEEIPLRKIAAQLDNPEIVKIVEQAGSFLGIAITNVLQSFNPSVVTIGGGVIEAFGLDAQNIYVNAAINTAEKFTSPRVWRENSIQITKLGNDAALYGGASLFE